MDNGKRNTMRYLQLWIVSIDRFLDGAPMQHQYMAWLRLASDSDSEKHHLEKNPLLVKVPIRLRNMSPENNDQYISTVKEPQSIE